MSEQNEQTDPLLQHRRLISFTGRLCVGASMGVIVAIAARAMFLTEDLYPNQTTLFISICQICGFIVGCFVGIRYTGEFFGGRK